MRLKSTSNELRCTSDDADDDRGLRYFEFVHFVWREVGHCLTPEAGQATSATFSIH